MSRERELLQRFLTLASEDDLHGGLWRDLEADVYAALAAPAPPEIEVPSTHALVVALHTSGLTADMNPVERRKAALRLGDALAAYRATGGTTDAP